MPSCPEYLLKRMSWQNDINEAGSFTSIYNLLSIEKFFAASLVRGKLAKLFPSMALYPITSIFIN